MKTKFYVFFLLCLFAGRSVVAQSTIYVSPSGSASSTGSSSSSPTTLTNAIALVTAGGTISLASGTYNFSSSVLIQGKNGTASATIKVFAGGGTPILNFSGQALADANRGVILNANYWYFKGITIEQAGDNGMLLSGNNNTIENCIFRKNKDSGLQLSRYNTSATSISQWPTSNLILNCESYDNYEGPGDEDSDGFAAKLTCGEGNVFRGCIAHHNIDDGWDLYTKTDTGPIGIVRIENCIAHTNGTLTNGTTNANGDRNGFKLGGSGVPVNHIVRRSIAFNNGHHGFTDNNNLGSIEVTNNTSWNNVESNFNFRAGGSHIFRNNLSFNSGSSDKATGTDVSSSNVWWMNNASTNGKGLVVSSADFANLSPSISRNSDGSPNIGTFLSLASSSDMINAGVIATGITYNGSAPDVGAVESGAVSPTNYTLSTSVSPSAGGTITLSPSGGTYASGTVVTITATAASGYVFSSWSGNASGSSTSTTVTMTANRAVVANFTTSNTTNFTLSTSVSPTAGGTISVSPSGGSYASGTVVTVTATAASGYTFSSWSGSASGTSASTTVTMNANKSVVANFTTSSTTTTTIRIEDTATSSTGLCSYDGSIASNTGADNGKAINLTNSSAKGITWRVTAPSSGSYTLKWRYKNSGSSAATTAKLLVNGTTVNAALSFPKTANSTTFTTNTASVSLVSGGNNIRIETTVSAEFADIDWLEITGTSPTASSCSSSARESTDLTNVQEEEIKLRAYPNPSTGRVSFEFNLITAGNVALHIMDTQGKSVTNLSHAYPAGHNRIDVDLTQSKRGLYLCRLLYGNRVINQKIMLEK